MELLHAGEARGTKVEDEIPHRRFETIAMALVARRGVLVPGGSRCGE